jgi:hypothetical protein
LAKTRRPAKKRSSSKPKRSKPARKASIKSPKKKTVKVKAAKKIELKELRKQFASVLAVLSARQSSSPEKEAKLDDTRRRISQWMIDIDDICTPEDHEICGPDMAFPLP